MQANNFEHPQHNNITKELISMTQTLIENWQIYLDIQPHNQFQTTKKDLPLIGRIPPYSRAYQLSPTRKKYIGTQQTCYSREQTSRKSKLMDTPRTKFPTDYSDDSVEMDQTENHDFSLANFEGYKIPSFSSEKLINPIEKRYIKIREITSTQKDLLFNKKRKKIVTFKKQENHFYAKEQGDYLRKKYLKHIQRFHDNNPENQSGSLRKPILKSLQKN